MTGVVLAVYLLGFVALKLGGLLLGSPMNAMAIAGCFVESILATGLLVSRTRRVAIIFAGMFFVGAIIVAALRPSALGDCGCFGSLFAATPATRVMLAGVGGILATLALYPPQKSARQAT